jgi:putative hydrolase of the HAD superfamily
VIQAVVSDFGGVLTTPFFPSIARVDDDLGIPVEAIGVAMARTAEREGEPPLFKLERGQLSEPAFIAGLEAELAGILGRPVSLDGYGERLMAALGVNEPLFAYYRALQARGIRMALLTNNVREWEPLWRSKLPVDEVFELVVDSGFVGMRKPEPGIYALTLERLGLPGSACAFVDDLAVNVEAARAAGMHGVLFRDTDQAIAELDELLGDR